MNEQEDQELFSFIKENCNESRMYRNQNLSSMTLRDSVDNAFLSLLLLYIFNREFETAPFAQEYARRTMQFNGFREPRVAGTDLYQSLHILSNPGSRTSRQLRGAEQNDALRQRLFVKEKLIKDYLRNMARGTLDNGTARRLMYSLESQMNIDISNYKSLRRLITDWENLTTFQKKVSVTRLLQYFRTRARRSDLYPMLEEMSKKKDWELDVDNNAEIAAIGAAGALAGSRAPKSTLGSVAKIAGHAAAGYALAHWLTK